ncbi:uroporphyrinogen-III synthase [Methylobacterium sp. BTF04]|uniref:uroporphyrinogen-III synthase n=1 Tax=Methylobacterium sp. BTF04 TaxID=2708300 RepID=UPI0013D19DEC|nr:uroporphyrinogen-III synthase [Methylobacterium sp. BTF04]NEU11830.1 uroporphyrinogen-III synthase [Methylobacterium sp. BTF04]
MRIWVARPEPGATRTGERLAALGHVPLVAPVLTVSATGAALPSEPFGGLLLTSAAAVAALGVTDRLQLGTVPVFAVGTRTADLARKAGFADVRDADGDAAALAALVRTALPPGARLLHMAGADRKTEPAASLHAAGHHVVTVVAYAAAAIPVLPAAVARALDGAGEPRLQAVLHYSRRSAATAHDLAAAAGRSGAFRVLKHYCLSADVAVPLVAAGIAVHFVPDRPTEDALLTGLSADDPAGT